MSAKAIITGLGFLKVFSFSLMYDDTNTALNDDHSIVVTEEMALKKFERHGCDRPGDQD